MNKIKTEKPRTITGRLGSASDIRNRVEIETDNGRVIPAKVADDVVAQLAEFFSRIVYKPM